MDNRGSFFVELAIATVGLISSKNEATFIVVQIDLLSCHRHLKSISGRVLEQLLGF
jgi:hypothetical protein